MRCLRFPSGLLQLELCGSGPSQQRSCRRGYRSVLLVASCYRRCWFCSCMIRHCKHFASLVESASSCSILAAPGAWRAA